MKILWVEDDFTSERESYWFGNLKRSQEIETINDFTKADEAIKERLNQFDMVVLDINLEGSDHTLKVQEIASRFRLSPQEFLEESGFHLFIHLLEKGFPKSRIVFLTGNVDDMTLSRLINKLKETKDSPEDQNIFEEISKFINPDQQTELEEKIASGNQKEVYDYLELLKGRNENTYEKFERAFRDARIIPPKAIRKSQDGQKKFQKWLSQYCDRNHSSPHLHDYLTLRRGIFNVIEKLKSDTTVQINKKFADWDKDTFLDGILWQIHDGSLDENEYSKVYLALCDYLTKPFEIYTRQWILTEDRFESPAIPLFFKLPPYLMRNWIAHGLISGSKTELNAQEACFTFLLVMKSMFDAEEYGYEDELKRVFDGTSAKKEVIINKLVKVQQEHYKDQEEPNVIEQINARTDKKRHRRSESWKDEDYILHFYTSYLFAGAKVKERVVDELPLGKKNYYSVSLVYELQDAPFNGMAYYQLSKCERK
ncbi:MAG: hypothetical protein DRI57_33615 [Deltaproteobacteria bacterium]|nr:MAG: hypothetical protein DRI57_33615 [Deltaproteobacteria bacterium]